MFKTWIVLAASLVACSPSAKAPEVPRGAVAIAPAERACGCVLLHLTASATPTRAIDRARIAQAAAVDPTLCAYELVADDLDTDAASSLRPYLLQAQGSPVDLARKPGEAQLHLVAHVENACAADLDQ